MIVCFADAHNQGGVNNDDAAYQLGELIADVKPQYVVDLGDTYDLESLCVHTGPGGKYSGVDFKADCEAGNRFNDIVWSRVKRRKKRLPMRVWLEGNHEYRIKKFQEENPHLKHAVSYDCLNVEDHYDLCQYYDGNLPSVWIHPDRIAFAHFHASGSFGRPISGEHTAYTLIQKNLMSSVQGHVHKSDYATRTSIMGTEMFGISLPTFQHGNNIPAWIGPQAVKWNTGLVILKESGHSYVPEFVSMNELTRQYGSYSP